MRRAAVLFIIVFVLIVFSAILVTNSLSIVQRVARLTNIRGQVEMKPPGASDFEAVTEERNALAGTVVQTGEESSAILRWPADGTSLRIDEGTRLTISKCRFDKRRDTVLSQFSLEVGRIWVQVIRALSADSKFEINTPTATAGVRGTTFAMDVSPDGATEVLVYEGKVHVTSGSKSWGVSEGQALAVAKGGDAALRELTADERCEADESTEHDDESDDARASDSEKA